MESEYKGCNCRDKNDFLFGIVCSFFVLFFCIRCLVMFLCDSNCDNIILSSKNDTIIVSSSDTTIVWPLNTMMVFLFDDTIIVSLYFWRYHNDIVVVLTGSSDYYIYSFVHLFIFQVIPQWTHVIHDKYIKSIAHVTILYSVGDFMNTIKDKLIYSQKEMFSKICFGVFLKITKFTPSTQLLHNLMCKIVNFLGGSSDEMYFDIGEKLLFYSMRNFVMITHLNCDGDTNYKYVVTIERSQFAKSYFK